MADSRMVHSQRHVQPFLRLPCEITSEIFQHCVPEDEFPQPSVKSGPLQLSHVCGTWRKLAIRTPRLWTKILLCTSTTPDFADGISSFKVKMENDGEALDMWMRRATPLLLSIHLRYPVLPEFSAPALSMERLAPVLTVFVENPARWKSVGLSLPRDYLLYAWYITQQTAPNVESFSIDDTSIPEFGCPIDAVFLKESSTKTLSMLSVRASICYPSSKATPFLQLSTLSLKHTQPLHCLHLLKCCPVLEGLDLHFYDLDYLAVHVDLPTLLLPRLRNFHLSHTANSENGESSLAAGDGGEIGLLLDRLNLPNLRAFYLRMTIVGSGRYDDPNLPWDYLSRLISRSNCSLNRMELHSPHIDTPSILEILGLAPDLKYLGIPADADLECNVARLLPSLDSLRIFKGSS